MAVQRMKGFGWFLTGVVVAPACYLVSSQVAAERARVQSVERAILAAEGEIRALETEFETRANHAQLERWNGDVLALAAPRPDQFVQGEMGLASLHAPREGEPGYQVAAFVVPSGVPEIAVQQASAEVAARIEKAAPVQVAARSDAPVRREGAVAASATASARPRPERAQAVAMLDDALLSDNTLGEILNRAKREAAAPR